MSSPHSCACLRRTHVISHVWFLSHQISTHTECRWLLTGDGSNIRAPLLRLWFFERLTSCPPPATTAADPIDLTDDRWEVFYLFEEESSREVLGEKWRPAAFAGYFTLFGFRNPVKGVSLRVCQALILPQFQRQGEVIQAL